MRRQEPSCSVLRPLRQLVVSGSALVEVPQTELFKMLSLEILRQAQRLAVVTGARFNGRLAHLEGGFRQRPLQQIEHQNRELRRIHGKLAGKTESGDSA